VTGCAQRGSSHSFELDFEDAFGPVDLRVELDAEFDGSLRLEHGECADSVLEACNLDHTEGVDRAVVASSVEPGRYRLVAAGEDDEAGGEFRLKVSARAQGARCATAPGNDTCEGAIDLDPTLAVQTVVGSTRCAHNDTFSFFECHGGDSEQEVFYRLDLRDRMRPVVVRASTNLVPTDFDTTIYFLGSSNGHCVSPIDCNDDAPQNDATIAGSSELFAELEPGEYFIAVDAYSGAGDFGLSVSLDEVPCGEHDTCATALDLDPSDGERTVPSSLVCAASSRSTDCGFSVRSADVYYRLDLSGREGPVRVRAALDLESYALALLAAEADGSCGAELTCSEEDIDLVLEPKLHYLMLSADRGQARPAELTISLEAVSPSELEPCVDAAIATCANGSWFRCCSESALGCVYDYVSCGLDPSTTSCVCETEPGCCDRSKMAGECWPVFDACGLFCGDFDRANFCAEEP
jgi:hypothetical protein